MLVRGRRCWLEEREDIRHETRSLFCGVLEDEFVSWTGLGNVYRRKTWLRDTVALSLDLLFGQPPRLSEGEREQASLEWPCEREVCPPSPPPWTPGAAGNAFHCSAVFALHCFGDLYTASGPHCSLPFLLPPFVPGLVFSAVLGSNPALARGE